MYRPISQCPWGMPYTVQPGDTLLALVDKFNVYWEDILYYNPSIQDPNILYVGQQLCIPTGTCPPGSFTYTVKPGDTLYRIARFFQVPLPNLIQANPFLNPDRLTIGQVICIPSYELSPVHHNGSARPNRSRCGLHFWNYTLQKGDTYYELSQWVKVTPDRLMSANPGTPPQALIPGQNLCIPLPYWNAALPQSKGIDTGYSLIETAYYMSSSQGYYFYVLPEYTAQISIKPRQDHLVSHDGQSHVTITRLFYETLNVHDMREFLRKELSLLGPVKEVAADDREPFFKTAAIFLSADVEERTEQRIVLFLGDMVLYFKISLAMREAYDELARVNGMLRTILPIPDPSFHE
ncbi:hypothetical protein J25TS5_10020 [Paenibacillus faecis]|uniref:LysM peptidoglycan-binding domain-containing protein n=1 Tax=Paenibacillus faecis TaxID=862114 RepID=UPI001B0BF506|nr:LysM peptidoglycan-binding domain-containing protein [Paenibacillus faecis]GIO84070.1 hypothetical protein J25TS5_10020 [Paenibacillus faecis]